MAARRRKKPDPRQADFFDPQAVGARTLIDELINDTRLYRTTAQYRELLDFVSRMRGFAPFNAMLLHIQKPGITHAATVSDWKHRFGCHPKPAARPLVILWPMGPVDFVYDIQDVEGGKLPQDAFAFPATGNMTSERIAGSLSLLKAKRIDTLFVDGGEGLAGSIQIVRSPHDPKDWTIYRLSLNKNHQPATQFATLAHELAHLFLGHLGADAKLDIATRLRQGALLEEVEAESVAYVVARRNGVTPRSQTYLQEYAGDMEKVDTYVVMRAAGRLETLLGLSAGALRKATRAQERDIAGLPSND